jgi:excisionase family DNA binding protein
MDRIRDGTLPPVLDTNGVADLLGLNPRTVLLMARDGRLPGRRVPGGRKYQFLTDEVLAALAVDGQSDAMASTPRASVATPEPPTDLEPCDIWGVAPAPRGPGWALSCLRHWVSLAEDSGLAVVCVTAPSSDGQGPFVGIVAVDDIAYRVLAAPRKRIRVIDDDGEMRWQLVDSVWVDPVTQPDE